MKKKNVILFLTGIFITAMLIFSACNDPLSLFNTGEGNVTISLSAGPSGRTLLPSALDFDLYVFTFNNGIYEETFSREKAYGGSYTFSVPAGIGYTLNVKAYKGTGEGKILAAEGNSDGSFTVNASTSIIIKLTGNISEGPNGTFSYTVQYPAGAAIDRLVLISGSEEIDLLEGASQYDLGEVKVSSNAVDVPAGWYGFELDMGDGNKVVYDDDIVSIYSDTVTFYGTEANPIVFTEGDFKAPPPPPENTGVRVYFWHGFDIEGSKYFYGDYPDPNHYVSGNAIGTWYETYYDAEGRHSDVLKLEPPVSSGYAHRSMILTRMIPAAGAYTLSMDYYIEKKEERVNYFWYRTGGLGPSAWVTIGNDDFLEEEDFGKWLHFEYSYNGFLNNDEIGIIARNDGNYFGLRDATIYIKNISLKDSNGNEVPPATIGLYVTPESFTLHLDRSRTLKANKPVTWSSSNDAVATVNSLGVVTAVGIGTATITAATIGNPSETAISEVTVKAQAEGTKYIALTFDDGPDPYWTPQFLEVLADKDSFATFMCIGEKVENNQSLIKEMFDAGHEIGNHTYYHTMQLQTEDLETVKAEIGRNKDLIASITGAEPKVFRAPALLYSKGADGGFEEKQYGENYEEACRQLGLALIDTRNHQHGNYDFDPAYSADAIFNMATARAMEWGILLLHDGWPTNVANTLAALPRIIDWLHDEGYVVVSASQLAEIRRNFPGMEPGYGLEPGRIYYDMVQMPPHVQSITVEPVTIEEGDTVMLSAAILPLEAAVQQVYWYSDDQDIAGIDQNTGRITAYSPGTATIRAKAGGMRTFVEITVEPVSNEGKTLTSWDAFDWAGQDGPGYLGSNAVGEVLEDFRPGDGYAYSNVLKLAPPEGESYNYIPGEGGSVGMQFVVPASGTYTLTYDAWVDSDEPNVNLIWYVCSGWGYLNNDREAAVETKTWLHRTGSIHINEGTTIGLLMRNIVDALGLRDAVVYLQNLTLELDGLPYPIIDIQGTAVYSPEDQVITLQWDENGDLISASSITVKKGASVTITAPPGLPYYQWRIERETIYTDTNTFVFDTTNRSPGPYSVAFYFAGIGGDAILITVTN